MHALVTGGTSGIGAAAAEALAAAGYEVTVCARRRRPTPFRFIRADVTRDAARIVRAMPRIDVLVNNAGGVDRFDTFARTSLDQWRHSLEWNLVSAVAVTRAALPKLRRSVIFVSSVVGLQPFRRAPEYCAAKAAMINLTKFLAAELAPRITVNCVCPGPVLTDSWKRDSAAAKRRVARSLLTRRMGLPSDVGPLIAFLAGARWITGSAFSVDGGSIQTII